MLALQSEITSSPFAIEERLVEFARTWPQLTARLESRLSRAAQIASDGLVSTTKKAGVYIVKSQSNSLGAYLVDVNNHTCTCPDHGAHAAAGVICKHRLAVSLACGWTTPAPADELTTQAAALHVSPDELRMAMDRHPQATRAGFLVYIHPNQGEITIPVLVSNPNHLHRDYPPVVYVYAITGRPFVEYLSGAASNALHIRADFLELTDEFELTQPAELVYMPAEVAA